MKSEDVLELFRKHGALLDGHFIYTSGKHGDKYLNKDGIYPHVNDTFRLADVIAEYFLNYDIDVVIGPAMGGALLAQPVAYRLNQFKSASGKEVFFAYAEKTDDGKFAVRQVYQQLITGKNVLVVEDLLTTGGSAKKVIETVREIKGNVVALAVICNRGNVQKSDVGNVPEMVALANVDFQSWEPDVCELCQQNIPVNKDVGKGKN